MVNTRYLNMALHEIKNSYTGKTIVLWQNPTKTAPDEFVIWLTLYDYDTQGYTLYRVWIKTRYQPEIAKFHYTKDRNEASGIFNQVLMKEEEGYVR